MSELTPVGQADVIYINPSFSPLGVTCNERSKGLCCPESIEEAWGKSTEWETS